MELLLLLATILPNNCAMSQRLIREEFQSHYQMKIYDINQICNFAYEDDNQTLLNLCYQSEKECKPIFIGE